MNTIDRIRLAWRILSRGPLVGAGETTSLEVARLAAKGLRRPLSLTLNEVRAVCASALAQYDEGLS